MWTQFDLENIDLAYKTRPNFKVVEGRCPEAPVYIFFSGNGLYYPNTDPVFNTVVLEQDRYEWESTLNKGGFEYRKAVFVRDVRKTWYVDGISVDYPNVDSVIKLLRGLIPVDTSLVCVGNSAGGYAASLFGIMLGAQKIFNISGYACLGPEIYLDPLNPALERAMLSSDKSKWFDLSIRLADSNSDIYYFYPAFNADDREQSGYFLKCPRVHAFPFASSEHGQGAPTYLYPKLFSFSKDKLKAIQEKSKNKPWTAWSFVANSLGLWGGMRMVVSYKLTRVVKKLKKVAK